MNRARIHVPLGLGRYIAFEVAIKLKANCQLNQNRDWAMILSWGR